ncbi:peptidoglycan-binding protein [Candidatus Kaiserbacteria bacterium]|nr:peptidoglycan-binding protein [Candidatus Kaiserbacteria bacterium]
MKKIALSSLLLLSLFGTQIASAQSYNYLYSSPSLYGSPSGCVSLSRDLSIGSRGSDVTSLQRFIVSRNYPGGGSWMITGYFGSATRAGVMNVQNDMNLPQTGYVDASTRAAISQATCGYSTQVQPINWNNYNYTNQYPYNYTYNTYPYNYNNYNNTCTGSYYSGNCQCGWYTVGGYSYYNNCGTQYSGTISISYLSPQSGAVGTSVTVYGNGFSTGGNSVRFGNGIITNLISTDGHSVSFVVPSTISGYGSGTVTLGTYNVSVTNSYGAVSNAVPFTVTSVIGGTGAPSITGVSGPVNLNVNTQGTWTITLNNNQMNSYTTTSVNWGDTNVYGAGLSPVQTSLSQGIQNLTFTHSYAQAGTYTIIFTVTGANGLSNSSSVTVNVTLGGNSGSITLSYISPQSGVVGTQIIISGTSFSTLDNTVHFGSGGTMHIPSQNGSTIYYTIPSYTSPCDLIGPGCGAPATLVSPGAYQIYVTNVNGTSNALTWNVQ